MAMPVEERHAAAAIRVLPDGTREHQIETLEFRRNLIMVLKEILDVFLSVVGFELDGSPNHLLAIDVAFAWLQKGDWLDVGNGIDAARCVLDEFPAFRAHVAFESTSYCRSAHQELATQKSHGALFSAELVDDRFDLPQIQFAVFHDFLLLGCLPLASHCS